MAWSTLTVGTDRLALQGRDRRRSNFTSPVCLPDAGTSPGKGGEAWGTGSRIQPPTTTGETTEGRGLSHGWSSPAVNVQIPLPAPVLPLCNRQGCRGLSLVVPLPATPTVPSSWATAPGACRSPTDEPLLPALTREQEVARRRRTATVEVAPPRVGGLAGARSAEEADRIRRPPVLRDAWVRRQDHDLLQRGSPATGRGSGPRAEGRAAPMSSSALLRSPGEVLRLAPASSRLVADLEAAGMPTKREVGKE